MKYDELLHKNQELLEKKELIKIETYQVFLEQGGYDLGYDADNCNILDITHLKEVLLGQIHIWDYMGVTREEYIGGKKSCK